MAFAFALAWARLAAAEPEPEPGFWQAETPLQLTGMVASETLLGFGAGILSAFIGADFAMRDCRDNHSSDEDYEGCGWSGLGGAVLGAALAAPLGQGLGVVWAGAAEGKSGNPWLTLGSAYAGDFMAILAFTALYSAVDGVVLPVGALQAPITGLAAATLLAIPVATYTLTDYHARFSLRPNLSWSPVPGETRFGMQVVEMRF